MIDDGSKDSTWNIMQSYALKDSRIEIYHQENQGVATTRNNLLDKMKGDFVLFVDSDDWIEPDMVEFLLKKSLETNADVATCSHTPNNDIIKKHYTEKDYDKESIIKEFLFHKEIRGSLWNKLIKANILKSIFFKKEISFGEDALFCWNFLQRANKIIYTSKELYHYRANENSLSHSKFSKKKLSGHFVWEQICNDVANWWPQYQQIAEARYCIEDVLLLRDAAHSRYKNMDDVRILQKNIKVLRHNLYKVNITTLKMKLYSLLSSHSYWLASKL